MKFGTSTLLFLSASTAVSAFVAPAFSGVNNVVVNNKVNVPTTTTTTTTTSLQGLLGNKEPTDEEVRGLFDKWNAALATGNSKTVAKRYAKSGSVLLPTVSDVPRKDFASKVDYFDHFLTKQPQGEIVESYVQKGKDWAMDNGIYEFTFGATGDKVKARYSFVYVREGPFGKWKISHHHSSGMPETPGAPQLSTKEVQSLFGLWNDALATLDSDKVAKRYASKGVLLPTVSNVPRTDYASIKDYFDSFLLKKPQGKILQSEVTVGDNWAMDVGLYEFTFGATGDVVQGRYSYVYVPEDGEWKIAHHHSSVMPEASSKPAPTITEDEARGLFYLWNDALATEDPDKVAKRYAKSGVLLATVSDVPRTDYDSIKDYFVSFLKKKPQGEIIDSYVTIGDNWCEDVGVYEFTMGADGSKVKARYTFVYVLEDGEWKISHHHSSMMPEECAAKMEPAKEEVEA